jgi:protein SCO1
MFYRKLDAMNATKKIAGRAIFYWAAAIILMLSGCSEPKPQFKSVDITGADYAQNFNLPDQFGKTRTVADFKGKAVVVFFGFTQCPDVCPTSLAELAEAKRLLGKDGDKLQGIFVSIDPERDTPPVLKAYMENFDPSFLALRGSLEQTAQTAKQFRIYYQKVDGKTPGSYTMDHSAGSYILDPQGRIRLFTRYGSGAAALADDIKLLLKEAS